MKIVLEVSKPRAKWLNDVLRAKRSTRHRDARVISRQQHNKNLQREISGLKQR